jgi:hypothetical protein
VRARATGTRDDVLAAGQGPGPGAGYEPARFPVDATTVSLMSRPGTSA